MKQELNGSKIKQDKQQSLNKIVTYITPEPVNNISGSKKPRVREEVELLFFEGDYAYIRPIGGSGSCKVLKKYIEF